MGQLERAAACVCNSSRADLCSAAFVLAAGVKLEGNPAVNASLACSLDAAGCELSLSSVEAKLGAVVSAIVSDSRTPIGSN